MKTISEREAREQKLQPMTEPYLLPEEKAMLESVIRDCRKAGCYFALVGDPSMPRVYRAKPGSQMKPLTDDPISIREWIDTPEDRAALDAILNPKTKTQP